jgi:hypothetical protein
MNKTGIVILTSFIGLLAFGHSSNAQGTPTSTVQGSRYFYGPPPAPPGTPWNLGATVTLTSSGAYYGWQTSKIFYQPNGGTYSTTPLVQNLNVSYGLLGLGASGSTFVGVASVPSDGKVKVTNTGTWGIPGGYGGGGASGTWTSTSIDFSILH